MLNIYRVDHISQVVSDLEKQLQLMEGLFGFRRIRNWENAAQGVRGVLLDVPGSWGHRWEILSPLGENSPLQNFLDSPYGPGLHHVAVEVTDMQAALAEIKQLGFDPAALPSGPDGRWIDLPCGPPDNPCGLNVRIFAPPIRGVCGHTYGAGAGDGATAAGAAADVGSAGVSPAGAGTGTPTLGIVAIEQVGHAHPDRDALTAWLERALGMREVYRTAPGRWPDMATLVLTIPGTHMRWEIIQPVGADSFVQRYLNKRGGAGAHHVTFEVQDRDQAMAACDRHGIPTFDLNEGETDGARWCDFFIHPKYTGGFLVQLFWEERPGVWSRSDKVPRSCPWT